MKRRMRQRLTNLASGELAAVLVFWINFFLFKNGLTSAKALLSIALPLSLLSFILLQGSVFWWILIQRMAKPSFAEKSAGRIYRILRILDVLILGLALPVLFLLFSDVYTSLLSLAIWLFAVIEWVNYYQVQLSYSLNPTVLLRYILDGKLRKSKIAREIDRH